MDFKAQNPQQDLSTSLSLAADRNQSLLTTLSQTDYAPAAHKQNVEYISDLKSRIAQTEKELRTLRATTTSERSDHLKYRDSTFKRFVYRLGGSKGEAKFSEKASKEEREFLDAWQKERETAEAKDELETALHQAQLESEHLMAQKTRHETAQKELDALYGEIFQGPTPELPGEDQLEENVRAKGEAMRSAQDGLGREKRAAIALGKADKALFNANGYIEGAKEHSRMDVRGGGLFSDMMERNYLSDAQMTINQSIEHIREAQRLQPMIRPLSQIEIDQGHMYSDIVFDNRWSDLRQHERILSSGMQIQLAGRDLQTQIVEQGQRVEATQRQVQDAANALEAARRELQNIRAEAFERYAANGYSQPPAYPA